MGGITAWKTSLNGGRMELCRQTEVAGSAGSTAAAEGKPGAAAAGSDEKLSVLNIEPGKTYQEIIGFGGAFNEIGWEALKVLDEQKKSEVIGALFGEAGCNLNMGRTPMGASDFALDAYSLDDVPGDFEMEHFSIERDKTRLIPYIKEAMKIKPELKVWGCPWSPPYWMKTSDDMCSGGELLDSHEVLKAYALYFDKYIKEYAREGVKVFAVCVQNETDVINIYPTSTMPPELMAKFIRAYLVPRLIKSEGKPLKTEIWAGSIRNVPGYADIVVNDSVVKFFVKRIGYQYSVPGVVNDSYRKLPGHHLVHTESPCHNGANSWEQAKEIFGDMVDYLENGCQCYTYWNMILDETTLSTWNWKQNSMINIDRATKEVKYNFEYYVTKHFSHFIAPGAVRIESFGYDGGRSIAFRNPDGRIYCMLNNPSSEDREISIYVGMERYDIRLDADSIYTVCIG
ncbi:MAG TPA: glycoside hydrolase family 30 protein [Clostridia bacterium]|nr:glycoside hydrolase family 30 protein [Clostridia bacterium]